MMRPLQVIWLAGLSIGSSAYRAGFKDAIRFEAKADLKDAYATATTNTTLDPWEHIDISNAFGGEKKISVSGTEFVCCCRADTQNKDVTCFVEDTSGEKKIRHKRGCGGLMGAGYHSYLGLESRKSCNHKYSTFAHAGKCWVAPTWLPPKFATHLGIKTEFNEKPLIERENIKDGFRCPGSEASVHASCKVAATVDGACKDVMQEVQARVDGQYAHWVDPHNNGTYTIIEKTASEVELTRMTGNKKYTDKLVLTFVSKGTACLISGCSESQVTSVSDFSTNYCNLRMLYCGSKDGCKPVVHDFSVQENSVKPSFGASKDPSACLVI